MPQQIFDPFDPSHWLAGAFLNWLEPSEDSRPGWMPERAEAEARLRARLAQTLRAIRLVHSWRTLETGQMRRFDPSVPATPASRLYLDLIGAGILEAGFPVSTDGRMSASPFRASFMALRLSVHDVDDALEALGASPVEIASLGPGPHHRARQAERHNLMSAEIGLAGVRQGWAAYGEAFGRFCDMTGDALMGRGGPDAILMDASTALCAETTASTTGIEGKFQRWRQALAHPGCEHIHVCWLDATRDGSVLSRLDRACAGEPRMHAAPASRWLERISCDDGFAPVAQGAPPERDWMRANMDTLVARLGLPSAAGWRLPPALDGR